MPLHDHFHPPLHGPRHWHSFHHAWATTIAFDLNDKLPQGYFAEPHVQFGIEIDVATLKETGREVPSESPGGWVPSAPVQSVPITITTDIVEVTVKSNMGGPVLVGAIELVSPANKHGPAERDAFVTKCASYLQQGAGLLMVDIVTERRDNLHNALLLRLQTTATPLQANLYAAAYRPISRNEQTALDIWQEPLAVGSPLPTMPLWLPREICMPLNLESTYGQTCRNLRITVNGT